MTTDEILSVWEIFDERMSAKFFDGLNMSDIYAFTPAEWHAAFYGIAPSDFKKMFFDRMDTKGIMHVSKILGDMDEFLEGLTVEDWKNLTAAEWECFLISTEIDEIVEFIHEMHAVDRKIVYDMFKSMPHEMLEDFREAPELSQEFSKIELETISHAVEQNISMKDSLLDDDEMEFERPQHERNHKNGRGRHGGRGDRDGHGAGKRNHNGKRENREGHGPEKPRNKKFGKN